jgi:hypothetical protein
MAQQPCAQMARPAKPPRHALLGVSEQMFGAKQQVPGPRSSDQESAAKGRRPKMKMSVLEWLHRNPGVHDIAVIARATGFNQKVVDRALTYHVRVGAGGSRGRTTRHSTLWQRGHGN